MSNIGKEFESRVMLTEDEYFNIVSYFLKLHPNKQFLQIINIYFDTTNLFLRNQHITLRARATNDSHYELTLKIKGSNGDDEINDTLTKNEFDLFINKKVFPSGHVRNYLLSLPYSLDSYKQLTSLYNRRLEIEENHHLIVIDKNTYSDITDYNLEVESKDSVYSATRVINQYVKMFNLSLVNQKYAGKASRAIYAARNNN